MAGIYIHIPFCKQKCTYCDFHFSTTFEVYRTQMVNAIADELMLRKDYLEGKAIETIYFGGGTPSLLSEEELKQLFHVLKQNYSIVANAEITLEANPDDVNQVKLESWKNVGINRLSIGIQSFRQRDLTWMNRAHNVEEAKNCIALARDHGFENLTVDLMYGVPDLTLEEWRNHIQFLIDSHVNHISAYCLTVENKTALDAQVRKGQVEMPSDEIQSKQFLTLIETLKCHGIVQYEISNFAKPGYESIHNSNYWKGEWYIGIGPSAHSFNGKSRSWNIANNTQYIKGIESNTPQFELEELTTENQFNELLLTGLRTIYGVPLTRLANLQQLDDSFWGKVESFIAQKWMIQKDNTLFLTEEGRLRADYVASELFIEN